MISLLSAKHNLDSEVVERIIRSEFEFVKATMEQGEFQAVRLHHLGVFGVKEKRLEQLNGKY